MRAYRFHKLWIGLFLSLTLVLGAVFRLTRENGEIFPFFSWTLFIYVPAAASEYEVEIVEWRGERFDPPRPLHDARGLLPGAGQITAQVVIDRMGRAVERRDDEALASLRRLFEREYLGAAEMPVRYRLLRQEYDPIERWRNGALRSSSELGRFQTGGEAS